MQIHFVLVAPARPENVGAAARALKTMGFDSLRLVATDAHQQPEATWVAHGAQQLLAQARSFDSLEQALQGIDLVIATTARRRGCKRSYWSAEQLTQLISEKSGSVSQVALLFGCEESGLPNHALEQANLLSYIPLAASYPSLNLAQAVMVYAYQLSPLSAQLTSAQQPSAPTAPVSGEGEFAALKQKATKLLQRIGAEGDPKLGEWLRDRLGCLTERDVRMLHTLLNDIDRSLR